MARRSKKSDDGVVIPNDPKRVFDEHFPQIRAAKLELEAKQFDAKQANGTYRNLLKAYKKAGGDPDALTHAMALSKKEPADIDREFRNLNDALLWVGVPVGTQLGLFPDGKTVATKIEDRDAGGDTGPERLSDKTLVAIEADGHEAGSNGIGADDNPYEDGSPAFLRWLAGWNLAQEQIATAMAPKGRKRNGAASEQHADA